MSQMIGPCHAWICGEDGRSCCVKGYNHKGWHRTDIETWADYGVGSFTWADGMRPRFVRSRSKETHQSAKK